MVAAKRLSAVSTEASQPTGQVTDLAGLIERMKGQLATTHKETAARRTMLREAAQMFAQWADAVEPPYRGELPMPKEISVRMRWWRKVLREVHAHHSVEVLLEEAIPWLVQTREYLEAFIAGEEETLERDLAAEQVD